jgi:hypothetical protein
LTAACTSCTECACFEHRTFKFNVFQVKTVFKPQKQRTNHLQVTTSRTCVASSMITASRSWFRSCLRPDKFHVASTTCDSDRLGTDFTTPLSRCRYLNIGIDQMKPHAFLKDIILPYRFLSSAHLGPFSLTPFPLPNIIPNVVSNPIFTSFASVAYTLSGLQPLEGSKIRTWSARRFHFQRRFENTHVGHNSSWMPNSSDFEPLASSLESRGQS